MQKPLAKIIKAKMMINAKNKKIKCGECGEIVSIPQMIKNSAIFRSVNKCAKCGKTTSYKFQAIRVTQSFPDKKILEKDPNKLERSLKCMNCETPFVVSVKISESPFSIVSKCTKCSMQTTVTFWLRSFIVENT